MDEDKFLAKIDFGRVKEALRNIRKLNQSDEVENYISLLEDEIETVENESKELHLKYSEVYHEVTNRKSKEYQFSDHTTGEEVISFKEYIEYPFEAGVELHLFNTINNDESFDYEYIIKDREKFSAFLLENSEYL